MASRSESLLRSDCNFARTAKRRPSIFSAGEWIDRSETTSMNDLFGKRMSTQELEAYA